MEGWIKLHRKMVNWEWYSDDIVKAVFLHLLLCANHSAGRWRGNYVGAGELITSYQQLAAQTGHSVQEIRTAIKKLKESGEITVKATNRYSLISLVNYGAYQRTGYDEQQAEQLPENIHSTFNQQISNIQSTTNNNDNNKKNDNNDKTPLCCGDGVEIYSGVVFIDGYDEDGYSIEDYKPSLMCKKGKGVVYMSAVQYGLLIDEIEDCRIVDDYIEKLADFIIDNNAKVKNHYETIRRWWREDSGLS